MSTSRPARQAAGFTLIEISIFIIVVSIGVVGILSAMNVASVRSADPLARKQALAIAESLLEEVESQAFTICDPDDPNVSTATTGASCQAGSDQSVLGPTAGETRSNANQPFDHVGDYHNFSMVGGITSVTGTAIANLSGYNAQVTIVNAAGGGTEFPSLPAGSVLRITVDVTGAATASLSGYRFRYDPTASP